MAFYVTLSDNDVAAFCARYDLGAYQSHEGIAAGVSNSNYHLYTVQGYYILTLFEPHRVAREDLPYFFAFSTHLASKGVTCPQAIADKDGALIGELAGRACAIFNFIEGHDVPKDEIQSVHCRRVGAYLAKMHLAADGFEQSRANPLAVPKLGAFVERVAAYMPQLEAEWGVLGLADEMRGAFDGLQKDWPEDLPQGAVHCDLFPDNVLFQDGGVNGVIDFYFAATDLFAYDLAMTLNAWCFRRSEDGDDVIWDKERARAMLEAYQGTRPLFGDEKAALSLLCRGAALRIFLTRAEEYCTYDAAKVSMTPHSPRLFWQRLKFHQENDIGKLLK